MHFFTGGLFFGVDEVSMLLGRVPSLPLHITYRQVQSCRGLADLYPPLATNNQPHRCTVGHQYAGSDMPVSASQSQGFFSESCLIDFVVSLRCYCKAIVTQRDVRIINWADDPSRPPLVETTATER